VRKTLSPSRRKTLRPKPIESPRSSLKSLPAAENHGTVQAMRSLNGAISACGARDAGTSDVSRACRWARWPMLSVNIEQPPQGWVSPGSNMKW
jgi:hypothetical protein